MDSWDIYVEMQQFSKEMIQRIFNYTSTLFSQEKRCSRMSLRPQDDRNYHYYVEKGTVGSRKDGKRERGCDEKSREYISDE